MIKRVDTIQWETFNKILKYLKTVYSAKILNKITEDELQNTLNVKSKYFFG